jgi:hypothetical protein
MVVARCGGTVIGTGRGSNVGGCHEPEIGHVSGHRKQCATPWYCGRRMFVASESDNAATACTEDTTNVDIVQVALATVCIFDHRQLTPQSYLCSGPGARRSGTTAIFSTVHSSCNSPVRWMRRGGRQCTRALSRLGAWRRLQPRWLRRRGCRGR